MKKRTLSLKKLEIFYKDIEPKIEKINDGEKMRIQTDLEFQQNEIKIQSRNLAKILEVEKHKNIEQKFSRKFRGGKAFATKKK